MSDAGDLIPGVWTPQLSDEKLQQVLVLRRAANHRSLTRQLYEVPEPVMVKDLQTQCEMAEKGLASGTLSEEQLWASIASVVASITVAIEASSKATTCTWLRDEITDGEISDDNDGTLKEAASNRVTQLCAASKEGFAKDLLGSVKELAEACRMVLAEAARIAKEARAQPKALVVAAGASNNALTILHRMQQCMKCFLKLVSWC